MGSGRAGAGGGGGGGGTTFDLPNTVIGNSALTKPCPKATVEKEVNRIIKNLRTDYLRKQFGSAMTRGMYERLFNLSVDVFQNKSWSGIKDTYGISGGPGCLRAWAAAVNERYRREEPDQKVQETVRITFEDFLLRALNTDENLYFNGSSPEIMSRLNQNVFKSTSAYFLGIMIWRILERQGESMADEVQIQLKDVAQDKADSIVLSFEKKFLHRKFRDKEQVTHQDLFLIIQENLPWFVDELRR